MTNEELKKELFRKFGAQLKSEGATEANTEIVESETPLANPVRYATLLGKIGNTFATLVAKWFGFAFIIYISWVQAVPLGATVNIPTDNKIFLSAPQPQQLPFDAHMFSLSGSAQLWITQFGENRPVPPPQRETPYVPCSGDKIIFVPSSVAAPTTYFQTTTGSYFG